MARVLLVVGTETHSQLGRPELRLRLISIKVASTVPSRVWHESCERLSFYMENFLL